MNAFENFLSLQFLFLNVCCVPCCQRSVRVYDFLHLTQKSKQEKQAKSTGEYILRIFTRHHLPPPQARVDHQKLFSLLRLEAASVVVVVVVVAAAAEEPVLAERQARMQRGLERSSHQRDGDDDDGAGSRSRSTN